MRDYITSSSNISISPSCGWMPESCPFWGMYCIHTVENMSLPTSQSVVYTPIPLYHKWSALLCSHWQSSKMSHPVRRGKYLLILVLHSSVYCCFCAISWIYMLEFNFVYFCLFAFYIMIWGIQCLAAFFSPHCLLNHLCFFISASSGLGKHLTIWLYSHAAGSVSHSGLKMFLWHLHL